MLPTFVQSDTHALKQVIIHPIGNERKHVIPKFGYLGQPGFSSDILGIAAELQHKEFVRTLERKGIETLNTYDLINNALENLKQNNKLEDWLQNNFPDLLQFLDKTISAEDLIGASDRTYYKTNMDGTQSPRAVPLPGMCYTRDLAVALPEGVLLASFGNKRSQEYKLAKLIFDWSDKLKNIPVIFDAEKEDVTVQGGDVIVLTKNKLLMGIGNMSSREAAILIAKKLNKEVIGVVLPASKRLNSTNAPFSSLFLHLDTVFNLIDGKRALICPYFFESRYKENNPIYSVLAGVIPKLNLDLQEDTKNIVEELKTVGSVVKFEAGAGNQIDTGVKLGDYMKNELGYELIFVGGKIPESMEEQIKHMVEIVIPELRFQGANIVVTKPGEIIMYEENTIATQAALKEAHVQITLVKGSELARWNGGPHCMTLPLKRG